MIILGIDPGTARLGWGIIETKGANSKAVFFGCITTEATRAPPARLLHLHGELTKLLSKHKPDCMSIEELFFTKNAKTIIPVGQARGVAILAAAQKNISVVSYSPLAVKRAITGNGNADKKQVQLMITRLLRLSEVPKPDDTADALAIALTHAYSYKLKGLVK